MSLREFMETDTYKYADCVEYIGVDGMELPYDDMEILLDCTVLNHRLDGSYLEIQLNTLQKEGVKMDYTTKATQYAEEHGIIEYTVSGNKMIYYANYLAYLSEGRRTYKIVVNLDTMKEESRTRLKRWNRNGNYNMYK